MADGKEPVLSKARFTIRSFGVRRGDKIAAHITLRGDRAQEILQRGLKVKEFELPKGAFSNTGCFGFGIQEHIDLGMKYDPYTGIFGMDFFVVLKRPGYRVSQKKVKRGRIGNSHQVTKEEAQEWFKTNFEGTII